MPFSLYNTWATYQRLVDEVFNDQIRKNLKAYVDDMMIKSASEEDMLMDIPETFDRLRSINMKLNPNKCSFGVEEGPFLEHLITKHGIKPSNSKVKEIIDLKPPRTLKEIQSLNGKLATLSQFFSKGADKSLSFFKALKSCTDKKIIQWIADADEAFLKMKEFIEIPMLTAPIKGEVLVMYLAASTESVSVVLLLEREESQVPIYFINRVLQGA
ncbi:reverse transcriptase domain-containing protein [Tanacetum coccineum]